jgi:hypothetical protein
MSTFSLLNDDPNGMFVTIQGKQGLVEVLVEYILPYLL